MAHIKQKDSLGNDIPSVTNITAIVQKDLSGFQSWICSGMGEHACCTREAKGYMEEAAALGNRMHEIREEYLTNNFSLPNAVLTEYEGLLFEPIANFYRLNGYKPLVIEKQYVSDVYKLSGKPDGAGTFKTKFWDELKRNKFWVNYPGFDPKPGDVWIDDLKVKSKIDKIHPVQLYNYSKLVEEKEEKEAKWGLIIRRNRDLDKTPEIQLKGYYLPAYEPHAKACRLIYNFMHGVEE